MSRCWDYDDEMDPYWKHRMEEAYEAMHDREVGLIGQCQAARDYENLKAGKYPTYSSQSSCETPDEIVEEVKQETPAENKEKVFGLPIISW